MSLRDAEPGLPRGVEGRGRDLRGAAADLLGELVADDDRRRSEAPLDRPLADRVVEREGASGATSVPSSAFTPSCRFVIRSEVPE